MRVVQVHWAWPPTTGGVESHVADLATGLAARGCDVALITGEPLPEPRAGVTVLRTDALNLDRIRDLRGSGPAHDEAVRAELGPMLAVLRPDVVHGHNLHHFDPTPAIVLDELARRMGFRVHHTFHETWPDVLRDTPVYRRWAGNYAVSAHVQSECSARIGFEPKLRPLGIDTARFRTARTVLADPRRTPVILHPARLLPWKGVHVTVRMLARLRADGVAARLILTDTTRIADWHGDLEDYRLANVDLIHELDLGDRVELRSVSYGDMPALYDEADVVVYPTIAPEPFGLVPLEAMSSRRPVVASRCGGIAETVVDGETGVLVEPDDVEGLAAGVEQVLADPPRAREMGEAGRQRVRAGFELSRYIDDLLATYRVASMAK